MMTLPVAIVKPFFAQQSYPEMEKLLESSKSSSFNLQALSSKLGLVLNEIQA